VKGSSRRDQPIIIGQAQPGGSAGFGIEANAFVALATDWASISPLRATDRVLAHQTIPEATHLVNLRYRNDIPITTGTLIQLPAGDYLSVISAIDPESRHVELELYCKAVSLDA
jgi:SPP1 family predicted phage head-tail adaptor